MTLYILFIALSAVLITLGFILSLIPILGSFLLWTGIAMYTVNTIYRIHFFYSLSLDGALISVVSLARRSSVVVSFLVAAMLFHEKNLRSKAIDLALVLLGMLFLYYGSK